MRFLIFIFALALMAPVTVRAADNKIIIKSDDGKVTEYEIPEEARNRPVEVQKPEPAPQEQPVAAKPAPEPDPVPEVASAEDAPQESAVAAPETEAVSAPEPAGEKPQEEAASATPEEKPLTESKEAASEEAAVKQAPKVAAKAPVPVPGRKPEIVKAAYNMPTDSAIPQSTAVSIAIAHAPPASDFKVLRRMHEGVPVYAVAFKTDEGTHIVLVDARDGAVIAD